MNCVSPSPCIFLWKHQNRLKTETTVNSDIRFIQIPPRRECNPKGEQRRSTRNSWQKRGFIPGFNLKETCILRCSKLRGKVHEDSARNKVWQNESSSKVWELDVGPNQQNGREDPDKMNEVTSLYRARAHDVSRKGIVIHVCIEVCDVMTVKHALLRTPLITRHRAQSDPPSEIRPTYALRASVSGRPSFAEPCITSTRCLTTRGSFPHGRYHPSAKDESTWSKVCRRRWRYNGRVNWILIKKGCICWITCVVESSRTWFLKMWKMMFGKRL